MLNYLTYMFAQIIPFLLGIASFIVSWKLLNYMFHIFKPVGKLIMIEPSDNSEWELDNYMYLESFIDFNALKKRKYVIIKINAQSINKGHR